MPLVLTNPFRAPSDPAPTWARAWGNNGTDEYGRGIVTDTLGNTFVAGYTPQGLGLKNDGIALIFDNTGTLLESEAWDVEPTSASNSFWGAALATNGDFWVVGGHSSLDLLKYDTSGTLLYNARYAAGGTSASGNGWGIAVDSNNDVVICGERKVGFSAKRWGSTLKINGSTGAIDWVSRFNPSSATSHPWRGAAFDSSDNVFLCGYSAQNPGGQGDNCFVTKLNGVSAAIMWSNSGQRLYGSSNEQFFAAASDGTDFYAAGRTQSEGAGGYDALLVKYNGSTGSIIWRKLLGGTNGDGFEGVSVDSSGNVYAAGYTANDGPGTLPTYLNGLIAKYDGTNGDLIWQRYLGGSGIRDDRFRSIFVDDQDRLHLTGQTGEGAGGDDILIVKLKNDGSETGSYSAGAGQTLEYDASNLTDAASTTLTEDTFTTDTDNNGEDDEIPSDSSNPYTISRTLTTFS